MLLGVPVSAQMRGMSGMSLPMGGAGPLGPITPGVAPAPHGGITGLGPVFPGHRFNFPHNRFRQPFAAFPFGPWAYSGFWTYPVEQYEQPQVVFVPAPPEEPPSPAHVVEPKIINVPAAPEREAPPQTKPPVVLVWRDGRQTQVRRYAIIGPTLFDYTNPRSTKKIALDELDLDATLAVNQQHGVVFRIPATANEVAVNF